MNTNSLQSNETPIYNVHVVDLWSEKEAVLDLSTQILEGQDFRVIAVTLIQGMKCFGFVWEFRAIIFRVLKFCVSMSSVKNLKYV